MRLSIGVVAAICLCCSCASQLGDACQDNLDCSTQGERICDTAQLDGYCTVQGCNATTCPDEGVCVVFFPAAMLTTPCDPVTEDAVDPAVPPTNDCRSDEMCLTGGRCAQITLARRFCMKPCSSDGDCRDGYECAQTGVGGAEAFRDADKAPALIVSFCRAKL